MELIAAIAPCDPDKTFFSEMLQEFDSLIFCEVDDSQHDH